MVIEDILNEGRPSVFEINKDVCQRLGVMCAAGRDVFTSQVEPPRKRPIKRNVLSAISSLFNTLSSFSGESTWQTFIYMKAKTLKDERLLEHI